MAGAALVHSVFATTPAVTQRLAQRPRTIGAPAAGSPGRTLGETATFVVAIILVPPLMVRASSRHRPAACRR